MSWYLHLSESEDPPKTGTATAACGEPLSGIEPVYGEAGDEFRICPKCLKVVPDPGRTYRTYLFPGALLRTKGSDL